MYEDDQEVLNVNRGLFSHPQPRVPLLEGVQQGGHARVMVEELSEGVVTSEAVFDSPPIFVHALWY